MQRIDEIVTAGAARFGSATALRFGPTETSWLEFDRRVDGVAAWLGRVSAPGTHVGYLGHNSDLVMELLFGAARASMVYVGVNWRSTEDELATLVTDAGISVLVTDEQLHERARALSGRLPDLLVVDDPSPWRDPDCRSVPPQRRPVSDGLDEVVLLVHTSGTTGVAKAAMHTHRTIRSVIDIFRSAPEPWAAARPGEVLITHFPLFHIGGLHSAIHVLEGGGSLVILGQFDAETVVDLVETHRVPIMQMVPTMLQAVLDVPEVGGRDLSSLDYVLYGGSPMPQTLLRRALEVIHCGFVQHYGSTECLGTATYLLASEHLVVSDDAPSPPRMSTVGVPFPGVEVRVVDQHGQDVAPDSQGEIIVRSAALMKGYWAAPDATDEVLRDGWLHTGDVGVLDSDGYLSLLDRLHDVISSGGETISPREVEASLQTHPGVEEVAVVRAAHPRWGETPKAFVVLREGWDVAEVELRDHLRARIASYKIPTIWAFVPALPRNSLGKVLRTALIDIESPKEVVHGG